MNKHRIGKWLTTAGSAALLIAFTSGAAFAAYHLGDTVSNFTLQDADGVSHSLSDYDGQIVVLTFFRHT